nr:XRE family transcriptional regulator [Aerococcus urinae]
MRGSSSPQLPRRSLNCLAGRQTIAGNEGVSTVAQTSLVQGRSAEGAFPHLLRSWRQKRRLSQLDLALTAGVSQRHLSYLESGRAKPSRNMILQLSETLDVPLRERNDWLTAAGFAPVFKARPLDDPQMGQVMAAVRMMLTNASPFPAIAIDRAWNIRMSNAPFDMLTEMIGADLWSRVGGAERNLMRLFFHPGGIRPYVANWKAIAPLLWHRAQREAEALGGQEMKQVLLELAEFQDADTLWAAEDAALVPVLPLEVAKDGAHVSLFTGIATFGTAQDVTADELRIESFFPADEETERLFRAAAAR